MNLPVVWLAKHRLRGFAPLGLDPKLGIPTLSVTVSALWAQTSHPPRYAATGSSGRWPSPVSWCNNNHSPTSNFEFYRSFPGNIKYVTTPSFFGRRRGSRSPFGFSCKGAWRDCARRPPQLGARPYRCWRWRAHSSCSPYPLFSFHTDRWCARATLLRGPRPKRPSPSPRRGHT